MPSRPILHTAAWAATLGMLFLALGASTGSAVANSPGFEMVPGSLAEVRSDLLARPFAAFPAHEHSARLPHPTFSPEPDPPAPPAPTRFSARPADNSVAVFIPHGWAPPIPNVLPGHSDDITLTFDDCGTADQIQLVTTALAEVHRRGIFFVTGQCRDHFPWLVGTLTSSGHQVCNHTFSHPDLRRLSDAAIRYEIGRGVMEGCPHFRPPYGGWDGPRGRIARIAAEFGLTTMLWDVDSRDWAGAPAERIAAVAKARGGVVLLHLHGANTAEAVRLIG